MGRLRRHLAVLGIRAGQRDSQLRPKFGRAYFPAEHGTTFTVVPMTTVHNRLLDEWNYTAAQLFCRFRDADWRRQRNRSPSISLFRELVLNLIFSSLNFKITTKIRRYC